MPQATIEIIEKICPHTNADKLELAQILGFQCVVPIGMHTAGEKIIYIHPDSVLPSDQEWATEPRKYAKTRTKAMKIRGEWSEGIIIGLDILKQYSESLTKEDDQFDLSPGFECGDIIGVTHYVRPIVGNQMIGAIGGLPHSIPKTDEPRWETITKMIPFGETVDVTLKVDGQSWSAFYLVKNKEFGITGRRIAFDPKIINNYTAQLERYNIQKSLTQYCQEKGVSLCIRGESYGGNIQKSKHNPHSKMEPSLALFSVYLIDEHRYAGRDDPFYFKKVSQDLGIPHVQFIEEGVPLTQELIDKYSKGLKKLNGKYFEGVVMKGKNAHFKVINKHYDSLK